MTTPYVQNLINQSKGTGGGRSLAPAPTSPTSATLDPAVLLGGGLGPIVSQEEDSVLWPYVGNLGRMLGHSVQKLFSTETMMTQNEVNLMTTRVEDALYKGLNYFVSPRQSTGTTLAGDMARDIGGAVTGIFDTAGGVVSGKVKMGQLTKGLLEMLVEAPLTMATGEKIVDGEVVPASSPEMAAAGLSSFGALAGAGVYTKLAGAGRATIAAGNAGVQLGRAQRLGVLARNIGQEYGALAASGLVQEGLTNPEDISFEMIANNLANPITLVMAGGVGGVKTLNANRTARSNWSRANDDINRNALVSVPSAQQLGITQNSTLSQAATAVDALTTSDNWIEAGVRSVRNELDQVFIVPAASLGVDPESAGRLARQIHKDYNAPPIVTKPVMKAPASPVMVGRTNVYFQDGFDHLLFTTDDIAALSKETGISRNVLKEMQEGVRHRVKVTETGVAGVGKTQFKYKSITPVPLSVPGSTSRLPVGAYFSRMGDVLFSSTPLSREARNLWETAGVLPKERVLFNNTEATVLGVNKNGTIKLRGKNGKFANTDRANLQRIPDGNKSLWTKEAYNDTYVDRFLNFWNSQKSKGGSFDSIVARFAEMQNWTSPGAKMDFSDFIYRTLEKRGLDAAGGMGPIELSPELSSILDAMEKSADMARIRTKNALGANNFRVVPSGPRMNIVDIEGRVLATFDTLDEIEKFASTLFADPNVPNLLPLSVPTGAVPGMDPRVSWFTEKFPRLDRFIDRRKASFATTLRRADRMTIDIAERFRPELRAIGREGIGVEIADDVDTMMRGVDAMTAGEAKPIIKLSEDVVAAGEKVLSVDKRAQVTTALEQLSHNQLRQTMSGDQIKAAEVISKMFEPAGGSQAVKVAFGLMRDDPAAFAKLSPELQNAAATLQEFISNGVIQDEKILRYIDAIESGVDETAEQYIARMNWDKETLDLYKKSKKFFNEAHQVFGIKNTITGYAPWIEKWEGVKSVYNKVIADSEWGRELKRLGLTPQEARVTDITELVYQYTKKGIHHTAPVKSAKASTAGELLDLVRDEIEILESVGADAKTIRNWVDNFRGIPDDASAIELQAKKQFQKLDNVIHTDRSGLNFMMDAVTFLKMAALPILGLRDYYNTVSLTYGFWGAEAAGNIMSYSAKKMRQIEYLMSVGELPQLDGMDNILSRNTRSMLSTATDKGLKLSLQPQMYKMLAGNTYIYSYEKAMNAFLKHGSDTKKVMSELGDLLDSTHQAHQEFFLATAQRDPVEAAKFLARTNAYNIASRMGRLNNPLGWQGKAGRVFGQFGSWRLNALNILGEGLANSRSPQAALNKIKRLGLVTGVTAAAGYAMGLKVDYWTINPLGLLPSVGPVIDTYEDLAGMMQQATSFDASTRERLGGTSERFFNGLTPTALNDIIKAGKIWDEDADFYSALMTGSGFKIEGENRKAGLGTGVRNMIQE